MTSSVKKVVYTEERKEERKMDAYTHTHKRTHAQI
jgi:hypothetical protein